MKIQKINPLITISFILLFAYTSSSKLMNWNSFSGVFKTSTYLSKYSSWLPAIIISIEIVTVFLLIFDTLRLLGYSFTMLLMLAFTIYIGYMLSTSSSLPCSCGGILKSMSWVSHFWFNIFLTLLAGLGLYSEMAIKRQIPKSSK